MCDTNTSDINEYVEFVSLEPNSIRFDEKLYERRSYVPDDCVVVVKIYEDQFLYIRNNCVKGCCGCIYVLDGVPTQLRPCRIASIIWNSVCISCNDKFVLTGVCRGFKILDTEANLSYHMSNYKSILESEMASQMHDNIISEIRDGKISMVTTRPQCSHALGAVTRTDGRLRPITDCSRPTVSVNDYMETTAQKFNFARLDDTKPLLSKSGYGGVVDISNAYRSINIYPPHRKYVGFIWKFDNQQQWFCANTLCFGIKSAPYIFNCVSDFIARSLGEQEVICVNYLDDFFIAGDSEGECASKQTILINLLKYMGFKVNYKKVLRPTQEPKYLGVIIDLNAMCFRLPKEKLERTKIAVKQMLGKKHSSRKAIERLTGLLAHCATLVWGGGGEPSAAVYMVC